MAKTITTPIPIAMEKSNNNNNYNNGNNNNSHDNNGSDSDNFDDPIDVLLDTVATQSKHHVQKNSKQSVMKKLKKVKCKKMLQETLNVIRRTVIHLIVRYLLLHSTHCCLIVD